MFDFGYTGDSEKLTFLFASVYYIGGSYVSSSKEILTSIIICIDIRNFDAVGILDNMSSYMR